MKSLIISARPWFLGYSWFETDRIDFLDVTLKKTFGTQFVKELNFEDFQGYFELSDGKLTNFAPINDLYMSASDEELERLIKQRSLWYPRLLNYTESQIEMLKRVYADSLVIFKELHPCDEVFLDQNGISYINIFSSPVRFGSFGSYRAVYSNVKSIQDKISDFEVGLSSLKIKLEVALLKIKYFFKNYCFNRLRLKSNCAVIVGQCRFDYSKFSFIENRFVQLSDYEEKPELLVEEFDKIYYIPHPLSVDGYEDEFIKKLGIEKLEGIDTYQLLCSNKVKCIVGLSSSVLTEAELLGKRIERLFTNFVDIDSHFKNIKKSTLKGKAFWKYCLKN